MAKILLNVELNSAPATQQVKALQASFTQLANSLKGMNVNKDLTAQLNALSKAYKAINQNANNATNQTNANARAMSAQAKLVKANADAQVKLQRAQVSQTKATQEHTKAQKQSNEEVQKGSQSILSMLPNILKWQVAMTAVMLPIRKVREALHSLNETLQKTEDTVVVLQRVLGKGDSQKLATDLYQIAQAYGQTFENVSEVATNFARTGMDWEQTVEATKSALMAMNVAELDATQASDGLIAVLAQFNLTAQDSESVIDKINKTANSFPVTQAKMLAALQRTGGTAANANMTLEQTLGLITSLSKATGRSGENIGTALNSLINYSSKSSALDTFAGVSDSVAKVVEEYRKGAASIYDVWKELSKNINNMQEEQLDLLDQYFKSDEGSQLAQELGSELGELNDDIAGVYSTANTFRKNYFIALLKNIETATQAEQIALDAEGYSQKANNQYLDTYTAKVNTLKSKWEELANDEQGLLGIKKELVDIGIEVLNIIQKLGGLKTVVGILVPAITALFNPILGAITGGISLIVSAFDYAESSYKKWSKSIDEVVVKTRDLKQELEDSINSISSPETSRYSITNLDGLVAEYERLNTQTEISESEQQQLDRIVNTLSQTYKDLDFAIDNTTGRYQVQASAIRDAREEMLATIEANYNTAKAEKAYAQMQEILEMLHTANEGAESQFGPGKMMPITQEMRDAFDNAAKIYYDIIGGTAPTIEKAYVDAFGNFDVPEQYKHLFDSTVESAEEIAFNAEKFKEAFKEAKDEIKDILELQKKQVAVEEAQLKLQEAIKEAQKEYMLNIVEQYVDSLENATSLEEKQNAVIEARAELEKSIAEAKQKALLEALKAERESAEKTKDLEQKRLDIEKARIALANAQANRSVKVYNSATGSFEWQADAKAVADARDNLGKAIDIYNSDIEGNAYSELEEAINNGNTDTKTLRRIITKWANQWEGDSNPAWMTSIDSIITDFQNYVPSAEEITSANEKVEKAVKSLNDYLKNKAIAEIKTAINNGNLSASNINTILKKWLKNGEGADIEKWGDNLATQIVNAQGVYDQTHSKVVSAQSQVQSARDNLNNYMLEKIVDQIAETDTFNAVTMNRIAKLINAYKSMGANSPDLLKLLDSLQIAAGGDKMLWNRLKTAATYDDGGILNGLGGIKATTQPETVLNPDLTKQILQPSSNAAFSSFAQSLGLLFGTSKQLATSKAVSTINNNNNSGNTSNYTVNGVPISSEVAKKYTVAELFDNFALV